MKKIVITGMGAVTPVGIGVEDYWNNIIAGKSGIDTIKSFDPSELAVRFAGEINNFVPTDYLPKDLVRKTDPFMQYAYIAAEEALRQSGVTVEPERTGIVMGTAMSGVATTAFTQDALSGASHKKVGPRFIPKILGNIAAANIAIDYNMQGPSFTVSTACSSGGDAIYIATTFMQAGKADIMLAVGAESVLCPLVIYSLANAKALSRRNDDPVTASRPRWCSRPRSTRWHAVRISMPRSPAAATPVTHIMSRRRIPKAEAPRRASVRRSPRQVSSLPTSATSTRTAPPPTRVTR